mgnify:CR=1 FL=1
MKANKIYLERLRKNDFVERKKEVIEFRPTMFKDAFSALAYISAVLEANDVDARIMKSLQSKG